ncbi:putative ferric-chelate reductase (NADH) [Heracleum sosnowskyi]|uniref:Ferric-chelate reductase (NADH) n=1 Tax=Heracleum sosnowskyi TaxID=360622 RepID=A0AAD8MN72_9APIA|nr:putative ferric-chelate reductase (NADH) [Heracleum sosnowskyi]
MILMVLFGGYIFIWVMLPIDAYNHHWLLKIGADTMSTYFGTQGATILINTFPILFIAALGWIRCMEEANDNEGTRHCFWNRAVFFHHVHRALSLMRQWAKTDISVVAGEVALASGLLMWLTTIPRIRRKIFELFFYTHHLYIIFIVFFVFHVGFSYACTMLPGFYLFLIDRFLRFLQSQQHIRLVSARLLPCETVELNFSKTKGLSYTPTSIMFVNVPSISKVQWHPFTITSNSKLEPEKMSVMIKGDGSWSKRLFHTLSSPSSVDRLDVSVEGPNGPASTNFLR